MNKRKSSIIVTILSLCIFGTLAIFFLDFNIDTSYNLSTINTASPSVQLQAGEEYYMVGGSIGQDDYFEGMILDQDENVIIYGCVASKIGVFRHDPNLKLPLNSTDMVMWGDGAPSTLSLDSSGNIYLAGYHYPEMYLIKYNNNLELQWNKTWGYGAPSYNMIVDSNDNIFVAGPYNDDIILLKYSPNGDVLWNITSPLMNEHMFLSDYRILSMDSNDNIYLVYDQLKFGIEGYIDGPILRIFKLSNSGTVLLNFTHIPSNYEYNAMVLHMITMDNADNLYILCKRISFWNDDTFLLKYNNYGVLQWNKSYNFFQDVYPQDLIFDSTGILYLLGMGDYIALARISTSSGNMLWETPHTVMNERAYAIALDSKNNVYIAGKTFDTEIPDSDILLVKYDPNGNVLAKKTWDYHGNETGMAIVIDSNDEIFIAGKADSFFSSDYDLILLKVDLSSDSDITLFIIIGISIGVVAFLSIGIFLYLRKRSRK